MLLLSFRNPSPSLSPSSYVFPPPPFPLFLPSLPISPLPLFLFLSPCPSLLLPFPSPHPLPSPPHSPSTLLSHPRALFLPISSPSFFLFTHLFANTHTSPPLSPSFIYFISIPLLLCCPCFPIKRKQKTFETKPMLNVFFYPCKFIVGKYDGSYFAMTIAMPLDSNGISFLIPKIYLNIYLIKKKTRTLRR